MAKQIETNGNVSRVLSTAKQIETNGNVSSLVHG